MQWLIEQLVRYYTVQKPCFEVAESELSLLMRNNIMHVEKHSCEKLLCTFGHSAIKENYFPIHAAGFIYLSYLREKDDKLSKKFACHSLIETR